MISATFSRNFSGFRAGFGSCFGDFCSFSYFFSAFIWLMGWVWGAVLGILAVTATFHVIIPVYGLNCGSCFKRFRDYSSPRSAYYAINPL